jgi:hypothetical protein
MWLIQIQGCPSYGTGNKLEFPVDALQIVIIQILNSDNSSFTAQASMS